MPSEPEFTMPIMGKMGRLGEITWPVTQAHRDRAVQNHSQSLERLRERGGLCWTELYCILFNKGLFDVVHNNESNEKVRQYLIDELHYRWEANDRSPA